MTQNDGSGAPPPDVPPAGIIADAILTAEETKPAQAAVASVVETPSPAVVDPNYMEPTSLEAYVKVAGNISREEDINKRADERGSLISFLLQRIMVLESALMPFATQAMTLANARMCLIADGRATEPCGGTWFSNPPEGIQMQATEGLFFNACDALGRAIVQDFMEGLFARVQARQKAQAEKDAAVEAGETVH